MVAGAAPAGGVVAGNLYVVGGGDPLLAVPAWRDQLRAKDPVINDINALAQAIVDAGITRIDGQVIGDGARYDDVTFSPAWPRRFFDQDVVGPIDALMVNDGFAAFPGGGATDGGKDAAPSPPADAARILTDLLRARGVVVNGQPGAGTAPADAVEVATLPSLTVREMVAEMLTQSDNETAESVFKEVGRHTSEQGSFDGGAAGVTQMLTDAGVNLEGVTVVDGSGLSIDEPPDLRDAGRRPHRARHRPGRPRRAWRWPASPARSNRCGARPWATCGARRARCATSPPWPARSTRPTAAPRPSPTWPTCPTPTR